MRNPTYKSHYPSVHLVLAVKKIQSIARMRFAVQHAALLRARLYDASVRIPAAIKLQALFRGHLARGIVAAEAKEKKAGVSIVRFWRRVLARRQAREMFMRLAAGRKNLLASRLQAIFRGHYARVRTQEMRRLRAALHICAAEVIQRAFRTFRSRRYVRILREAAGVRWSRKIIRECSLDASAIARDIKDVQKVGQWLRSSPSRGVTPFLQQHMHSPRMVACRIRQCSFAMGVVCVTTIDG